MKSRKAASPVTLKDIASSVGVDASTVSRAINHPEKVKEKTLRKIQESIQTLNYHPNLIARGLQTAKSNLLAMVVPNFSNLAFARITRGFYDAMKDSPYEVIICSSQEDPLEEIEISKALVRQRVSGIVYVGSVGSSEHDIPFEIFKNSTEVLVIDRDIPHEHINVFLIDAYHGIKTAFSHLINLGHRNFGIVTGYERSVHARMRVDLIRSILDELAINVPQDYFRQGDWTAAGGWHAMEDLLRLNPRPTVVFAITDTMAMGVIGSAYAAGLSVPDDISVIGFNNEPGSESFNPPLTTIGPPAYSIGMQAGKLILERIEREYENRVVKKFPVDLIIRKSTAAAP
jgi:DNA-binding LacI/PurR family transcriptional regulator